MRALVDVLGVALGALAARPGRALLMAVGPLLGVAVIVGAIGVLTSTNGELRAALRDLGGNVAIVSGGDARLPVESAERVRGVNTVEHVGGAQTVVGLSATTVEFAGSVGPVASNQVMVVDTQVLDVVDAELMWGRRLEAFDEDAATTAVVVGWEVAQQIPIAPESLQVLHIAGQPFGIVGVLERNILAGDLNRAVLIPRSTAQSLFGLEAGPTQLYVRIRDGAMAETATLLPTAVTFGERRVVQVSIPTELLEAQAAIDQTLAGSVIGIGLLSMVVGGFGIANVMLISVLERQREIGVRRALGHRRIAIAAQFLTEGTLIGLLGATLGAGVGTAFVAAIARTRDWTFDLEPRVVGGAAAAAVIVTILAALYPTIRAVRIQPLDALRAG